MMLLFHLSVAWSALEVAPSPIVAGVAIEVRVTKPDGTPARGETVRVIHHPDSPRALERAVSISDRRGVVSWTPEYSGVAELRAGPYTERVLVGRDEVPTTPLILFLILLTLVGSMVPIGLRRRLGTSR